MAEAGKGTGPRLEGRDLATTGRLCAGSLHAVATGAITRMSHLFLRPRREAPAEAEVTSHRLLLRAGYIRRTGPGIFTWLPLGKRVVDTVAHVVREEMDRIGAQEVLFPAL